MKKIKPARKPRKEHIEREDSVQHVDWDKAERVTFPNLKPTTAAISLRMSASMLVQLKREANKRDVPYQSLMKLWLAEKLAEQETRGSNRG